MEIFMHTQKGVRRDSAITVAPADRVFLVVRNEKGVRDAWKCELRQEGVRHPAFKKLLAFDELERGLIWRGRNGSLPTATFKPDSLYRRVTVKQLREEAAKFPSGVAAFSDKELMALDGGTWLRIASGPVLLIKQPVKVPSGTISLDCFDPKHKWYIHVRGEQVKAVLGKIAVPA
jgi:hypothetical protein